MARKMTRAQEARIAARNAEDARHDARRAAAKAEQARLDAAYAIAREAIEARERAARAAAGLDPMSEKVRSNQYDARMKALTGHKNGVGEWHCAYGHRHKTTANCWHGKPETETTVTTVDSTGATAHNLPLNTVAGHRIDNRQLKKWNRITG